MSPAVSDQENNSVPASPFRDRDFRLLWLGQIISSLGDAASIIVIPIAIYTYTHGVHNLDKITLSIWALASALPVILLGLFAGVFVDRWNRRRTMIVSDLVRTAVSLLLLLVHSRHDLWLFYVAAFLASAFSCFFSPARSALMASLLPRQILLRANAVSASGVQIVSFAGPVLTALLLKLIHVRGIFLFDAVTFFLSAVCIFLVNRTEPAPAKKRLFAGVWHEIGESLTYIRCSQTLSAILIILSIVVLGAGIYNTLEVAFAKDVWRVTDGQFAGLMAAFGVGMITAGLLVAGPLRDISPPRLVAVALGLMTVASLGFALAPTYQWGGAALFLLGLGNMLVNIPFVTLFQNVAPNNMLGRISSTAALVQRTAMFIAAGLAGYLSTRVAWRPLFAGLSVAYFVCALLALPLLERRRAPAPDSALSSLDT